MATYNVNLTSANSEHGSLLEPDSNYNGYNYFSIGNNDSGSARFLLLRLPLSALSGTINSAILTLPQYNDGNSAILPAKVSPVTGAWSQTTRFDTLPAYNAGVTVSRTFNESLPSSSNYDYRTGYHATRYKYKRYYMFDDDYSNLLGYTYFTTYYGTHHASGDYFYVYDSTISAYYDTYVKYRAIDITTIVQWLIDNGKDSILIYFDLPGTNSTRKYFFSPISLNSSLQPGFAVNYISNPVVTTPTLDWHSDVTTSPMTFECSDASDTSGNFTSAELYYELQISLNGGTDWGGTHTSSQGVSAVTVDLKTYLSIEAAQYYYNTSVKIRMRAKTPLYEGEYYYSSWRTSDNHAIDYRLTPTAPVLTPSDSSPYEGEAITFTLGRPATYNTHKADGSGNTLDYRVEFASGTALINGAEAVTSASKVLNYTVGNLTSGKADLSTNIRARCIDGNSLTGAYCANQALTIKRFRAPIVQISKIDRSETSALIYILIVDTGYGASQYSSQINKIQYDIGAGYVDASLDGWDGLANSFTISDLDGMTSYSLSVRVINNAPEDTALSDKTGDVSATTIVEFRPTGAWLKDNVSGVRTGYARAMIVGDDDEVDIEEGCAKVQNDLDVGGDIKNNGVSILASIEWFPTVEGSTAAGTGWSLSVTVARYVKIGNAYIVTARIGITTKSGDATGNVLIKGLPAAMPDGVMMPLHAINVTLTAGYTHLMMYGGGATVYQTNKSASTIAALPVSALANGSVFYLSGTYVVP